MIDYTKILTINYPNTEWVLNGDFYDGLIWNDESPKPTKEELDALWEYTQTIIATKKQTAKDTRASALAKLAALGLTQDEVKALVG